jgi:hypothetical protein
MHPPPFGDTLRIACPFPVPNDIIILTELKGMERKQRTVQFSCPSHQRLGKGLHSNCISSADKRDEARIFIDNDRSAPAIASDEWNGCLPKLLFVDELLDLTGNAHDKGGG